MTEENADLPKNVERKPTAEMRRLDLVIVKHDMDEDTGILSVELEPDPRRYEWGVHQGEKVLFDRLDRMIIPEKLFQQMSSQLKGLPLYYQPPRISSSVDYVESRKPLVRAALDGIDEPKTSADPSRSFLDGVLSQEGDFVILSLDIVGSTAFATTLAPDRYSRLIQTALYEFSEVVPLFRGHVRRYTGDGIIAYSPAPSFITKNDLAIDCALTLRQLVQRTLNPALIETGYPEIHIRIGLDSGAAVAIALGSPATKRETDLVGAVVSLACKIQARAPVDGIALGDITLEPSYSMALSVPRAATWE